MFDVSSVLWYCTIVAVLQVFAKDFQVLGQNSDLSSSHTTSYPNTSESTSGQWSTWSQCSRTCDVGIKVRSRKCHKKQPDSRIEELPCLGEFTEHKICKLEDCPVGSPDFRSSQCSRFNNRLVAGLRADSWVPTNDGANPCELRCTAQGIVSGFGKVQDGTPCKTGLCLDGRCLKVGCDERLGSGEDVDMCGVCGGRNSTCVHYKDIFYGQMPVYSSSERRGGYQEVAVIPVGSRNLEIKQRIGDNVLAVRDHNTAVWYYGNDRQEGTSKSIAGTLLVYNSADGNKTEILTTVGPITTELYVLVLLRERNFGIYYQYWLPVERQHVPRYSPLTSPQTTVHATTLQRRFGPRSWTTSLPFTQTTHRTLKPTTQSISNNRQIYGPKRQGLFYAHFNYIHSKPIWQSAITTTTTTTTIQPFFVPRLNINYKTRKPVFDFYERYRNASNYTPSNLPKKQDYLPPPQRDSGIVQIHDGSENRGFNEVEYKSEKDFRKSNFSKFRKPHHKWKYSFNGKLDGDDNQLFTTPVSVAVLPLPEYTNYTKTRRGKRRGLKQQPSRPSNQGPCSPCQRVRDQTKHFCTSDFVIRAIVLGYEFHQGQTRYELEVIQSFKNTFALLSKEYVWSPDTCRCPKLRVGKEYVIMGKSDVFRRNESRLLVDKTSFVRNYNHKYNKRLLKLRKEQNRKCSTKVS